MRAVVIGFCLGLPSAGANDLAFERIVDLVETSAYIPADIVEKASARCDTALCFAKALTQSLPDRLRLEPVAHPDTDAIRWVATAPSIVVNEEAGNPPTLQLKITHFGRKAETELREALATGSVPAEVDLRGNRGGDFERMLKIAGLLIGPVRDAVEIVDRAGVNRRSLEGPKVRSWRVHRVRIDDQTASAALLLARLLEAYAGTEREGPPSQKDPILLKRRLTVDHNWRLILPVAELRVTGR